MRRFLLAVACMFGAESAALACSCIPASNDPAETRRLVDDIARDAVALVEVDVRSAYDARTGRGEHMRVRRTLAGRVSSDFRLARRGPPSSAACDVDYVAGSQPLVLLYRADRPIVRGQRQYRDGGLCVSMFLHNPRFRQMLVEAMRRRPRMSESSASPPAAPCASSA